MKYTRDEKINYYIERIAQFKARVQRLQWYIQKMEERLAFIQSPDYQEWNSDLEKELHKKRAK